MQISKPLLAAVLLLGPSALAAPVTSTTLVPLDERTVLAPDDISDYVQGDKGEVEDWSHDDADEKGAIVAARDRHHHNHHHHHHHHDHHDHHNREADPGHDGYKRDDGEHDHGRHHGGHHHHHHDHGHDGHHYKREDGGRPGHDDEEHMRGGGHRGHHGHHGHH
ncbi:hypothetical protein F4775DRAFT_605979 [Biscogniauxia sp. FL1348]|nr:hypothetical protein F4775DRAFT_605979 [Biscogniauxia sp. FL1348]